MKKILYILLSVALLCGCVKDHEDQIPGEPVAVHIGVHTREMLTGGERSRVVSSGINWLEKDVRYILEVWTRDGERVAREVETRGDLNAEIGFVLRLISGTYDFLFWADIVPEGTEGDDHYTTTPNLKNVKISGTYTGSDDSRDAFACHEQLSFSSAFTLDAILTRPLAKLVIRNEGELSDSQEVTLTFNENEWMDTYNVLDGTTSRGSSFVLPSYPLTSANSPILAWDYLFVPDSKIISLGVSMGTVRKQVENVPIEVNKITRVTGQFIND